MEIDRIFEEKIKVDSSWLQSDECGKLTAERVVLVFDANGDKQLNKREKADAMGMVGKNLDVGFYKTMIDGAMEDHDEDKDGFISIEEY